MSITQITAFAFAIMGSASAIGQPIVETFPSRVAQMHEMALSCEREMNRTGRMGPRCESYVSYAGTFYGDKASMTVFMDAIRNGSVPHELSERITHMLNETTIVMNQVTAASAAHMAEHQN